MPSDGGDLGRATIAQTIMWPMALSSPSRDPEAHPPARNVQEWVLRLARQISHTSPAPRRQDIDHWFCGSARAPHRSPWRRPTWVAPGFASVPAVLLVACGGKRALQWTQSACKMQPGGAAGPGQSEHVTGTGNRELCNQRLYACTPVRGAAFPRRPPITGHAHPDRLALRLRPEPRKRTMGPDATDMALPWSPDLSGSLWRLAAGA